MLDNIECLNLYMKSIVFLGLQLNVFNSDFRITTLHGYLIVICSYSMC